jgi:hypothetical protein
MSADEVVTTYRYIEGTDLPKQCNQEIEIKVECWIDPGQDGSTNSYGVPMEPSYPPCVEDYVPIKARFAGSSNWHDYEYFVNRWGIKAEIKFDVDRLFEMCADKAEQDRIDHELMEAGL